MNYMLNGHETERLFFRLLQPDDFEDWLELFEHPDGARYLALDFLSSPQAQCDFWFKAVFDRYESNRGGMNVLIDKQSNRMVGQCGLLVQEVDEVQELEIGYSILPAYWNLGYATEAARYCKQVAFAEGFAESLISLVHVDNIRSKKVAIKNGMTFEKSTTFRDIKSDVFRVRRLIHQP